MNTFYLMSISHAYVAEIDMLLWRLHGDGVL